MMAALVGHLVRFAPLSASLLALPSAVARLVMRRVWRS
jgi:hypothetical protein